MSTNSFERNPEYSNKLPSPVEMARFDRQTIDGGVPSSELMERAGAAMKFVIDSLSDGKSEKILILVGPGNNGGDGLVIARLLLREKRDVRVIVSAASKYSNDHAQQAQNFLASGGQILLFSENPSPTYVDGIPYKVIGSSDVDNQIAGVSLIIDGLLGIAQRDAPNGDIAKLLKLVLDGVEGGPARFVALDVPTGVDCDSGKVYEPHVNAEITLTVELVKRGMVQCPAQEACGQIEVLPIGISCSGPCEYSVLDSSKIAIPFKRRANTHKRDFGHVIVVGGSRDMPGAPVLSARASLRSGAGLVTLLHLGSAALPGCDSEIMLKTLEATQGYFSMEHAVQIKAMLRDCVVVLGPGLGSQPNTSTFVIDLIEFLCSEGIKTVLDADGLNILASDKIGRFQGRLNSFVLTPHPGEAGRLLKKSSQAVQDDRYASANELARLYASTIVLKGHSTVVYYEKTGLVNSTGNAFMATAGSGDVLSGIIAALMAQGLSCQEAAASGVYLHGMAGDLAHEIHGGPIIAGDMIVQIPFALGALSTEGLNV